MALRSSRCGHHSEPRNGETRTNDVTAVILTLNESAVVARAIKSLTWCSEIHVLDSGSTDSTLDICKQLGVRIHKNRQAGPFLIAEQRNWALDNIPSDATWMLFLDADEECTSGFADSIMRGIESSSPSAYYAAPAFFYHGHWLRRMSGYPNWHPRLLRRDSGIRFGGGVWEDFVMPRVGDYGVPVIGHLREPYLHYANAKGANEWLEKHIRYASWEADKISAPPATLKAKGRRGVARKVRYRLGPLRKFAALFHILIVRRGILDGPAGWSYARRMFVYEKMIDIMVEERSLVSRGGSL